MLRAGLHLMYRYMVKLHPVKNHIPSVFVFFLLLEKCFSPDIVPSASQEGGSLKSPSVSRGAQRYIIDGLSEKSSVVPEPWERLLDILAVAGARCEWQGDKGQRYFTIM